MADKLAVLLVDDHPVVRQGLARLIEAEPDLRVCGQADSPDDALAAAATLNPSLAVVDLMLHGHNSLDLIRRLRADRPGLRVLVLSMHEESAWAVKVLQAGAIGYVMKQEAPSILMARIRQAIRGETAVSEAVAAAVLKSLTWDKSAPVGDDRLGDRELQVLTLLGQGQSSREIAAGLHISVKTVDAHREHIKRKLGLKSAAELIRYAVLKVEREAN